MKGFYTRVHLVVLMAITLFIGCKRSDADVIQNPTTPGVITPVDDLIQVKASISGIVLDETNKPIADAVVTSGAATTTTNRNGMFSFKGISVSKENGSVTVVKAGYFKGIRSFKTIADKDNAVRIQLMAKTLSGTVDAASGGVVNSNGNASISFPANAFLTSTDAVYTGAVKIYSRWIDPTAANLASIIPGDLRGVDTNGIESILTTYGMVGAELEDASGNPLKIANGKKATISFPLPASLTGSAPANITLWHFDDATARWKENGKATKTGNTYIAEVDKFSFWNCDIPSGYLFIDLTLVNSATNSPFVNTSIRIRRISNGTYGYGIANYAGFVSVAVPSNEALELEVVSYACNTVSVLYTQNIAPLTTNKSLGNININLPANQYIAFSGVALNCNNAPVTDGYVSFYGSGGANAFVNIGANGSFNFSILNCSGSSMAYECQAIDYNSGQQSSLLTGTASGNGSVNLGNILACGSLAGANVYVAGSIGFRAVFWKNSVATYVPEADVAGSIFVSGNDVYVVMQDYNNTSSKYMVKLWKNGIVTNITDATYNATPTSIFVSGSDVYITGWENTATRPIAKLWKNGVAINLTNGDRNAEARSVYVSGSDVYVAGAEEDGNGKMVAKLWKNGVPTIVSTSGVFTAIANSVFVSGSDVYVAVVEAVSSTFLVRLWKNGIATNITDGTNDAYAASVFVSGNDVYLAGGEDSANAKRVAKIWKNGVATNLTNGTNYAEANSVFVSGNDVYVVGTEAKSFRQAARLWKNGIASYLGDGVEKEYAGCVFVK